MCLDTDIAEMVDDFAETELENMEDKVINQQRSLWMNQEGVLEHRRALHAEKERKARLAAERAAANEQRSAEKKRVQDAQAVQYTPRVNARTPAICLNDTCGKAGLARDCQMDIDDLWRGCPFCEGWFCHRKVCVDRMFKHMPICRIRQVNSGNNNNHVL
jgi:hypothetical protein